MSGQEQEYGEKGNGVGESQTRVGAVGVDGEGKGKSVERKMGRKAGVGWGNSGVCGEEGRRQGNKDRR